MPRTDATTTLDTRDADVPPTGSLFAITLWQPFATLWAAGLKTIETRGWPTNLRGRILIHAASKWDQELQQFCNEPVFREALAQLGYVEPAGKALKWIKRLPIGAIVGAATIIDCVPTTDRTVIINDRERAFGDYAPRRFGWRSTDQITFDPPIAATGSRRLWVPKPDALEACRAAIARHDSSKQSTHGGAR